MDDRELERLKWRSRRGLLELDLVFTRFWEKNAGLLNRQDMLVLDKLLQLPDNDILDMVMDRQTCNDAAIREMIQRMQTFDNPLSVPTSDGAVDSPGVSISSQSICGGNNAAT